MSIPADPILGMIPPQDEHSGYPTHRPQNHLPGAVTDSQDSASQLSSEQITQSIASLNPLPIVREHANNLEKHLMADSHELAHDASIKGAVQSHGLPGQTNGQTRDIGWHKANADIPDPLIEGFSNGQLFAMIRRFNKVRGRRSRCEILRDMLMHWLGCLCRSKCVSLHCERP